MPAPIALFAYCRPVHLSRIIDALRRNLEARDSHLYVFCDAAKNPAAQQGVDAVRDLLRDVEGFSEVNIVRREKNYGLAKNITTGVTEVLQQHPNVVVVEDDVLVAPHFLRFMNDALTLYRHEPRVGSVSGYCYPVVRPLPETFFIKGADCWGWATWRDRWVLYNSDGVQLLDELNARRLEYTFDFDGTMGFTQMLKDQIAEKNDSWAVRWHASCFLRDRLILYPCRSLVENIGHDGSGTHAKARDHSYDVQVSMAPVGIGGIEVEESEIGRAAFCDFFRRSQGLGSFKDEMPSTVRGTFMRMLNSTLKWMG